MHPCMSYGARDNVHEISSRGARIGIRDKVHEQSMCIPTYIYRLCITKKNTEISQLGRCDSQATPLTTSPHPTPAHTNQHHRPLLPVQRMQKPGAWGAGAHAALMGCCTGCIHSGVVALVVEAARLSERLSVHCAHLALHAAALARLVGAAAGQGGGAAGADGGAAVTLAGMSHSARLLVKQVTGTMLDGARAGGIRVLCRKGGGGGGVETCREGGAGLQGAGPEESTACTAATWQPRSLTSSRV